MVLGRIGPQLDTRWYDLIRSRRDAAMDDAVVSRTDSQETLWDKDKTGDAAPVNQIVNADRPGGP